MRPMGRRADPRSLANHHLLSRVRSRMSLCVIIPAAGASARYIAAAAQAGNPGARSKLDEELGGRPILQRTVELFANHPRVTTIIVAGPHDPEAFIEFKDRYADKLGLLGVRLTRGGKSHRYETVAAALALVPAGTTTIVVHDAARPCTPVELIDRLLDAGEKHPAVIPALPVSDTIKQVSAEEVIDTTPDPLAAILGDPQAITTSGGGMKRVEKTIPRERLVSVQTPQVFDAALLRRAYQQTDLSSTDDAQLIERLGEPVVVIEGDARNIKVTRPADLVLARAILGIKEATARSNVMRF